MITKPKMLAKPSPSPKTRPGTPENFQKAELVGTFLPNVLKNKTKNLANLNFFIGIYWFWSYNVIH